LLIAEKEEEIPKDEAQLDALQTLAQGQKGDAR